MPGYIRGYGLYNTQIDYRNSVPVLFVMFFLGSFSIIGLVACSKRLIYVLPVYLFHLALFWILMSDSRRALPIVPFMVMLGAVGMWKVICMGFPEIKWSVYKDERVAQL